MSCHVLCYVVVVSLLLCGREVVWDLYNHIIILVQDRIGQSVNILCLSITVMWEFVVCMCVCVLAYCVYCVYLVSDIF
jgi:hypothetical protein